jgi:hypothetical protein
MEADRQALPRLIRGSVVGDDHLMETPYGRRRVTYADCTASGRALTFLEDFIREQVRPGYANSAPSRAAPLLGLLRDGAAGVSPVDRRISTLTDATWAVRLQSQRSACAV